MPSPDPHPLPQPTESEAIVAAQREVLDPGTRLVAAVPLPVDIAAALPTDGAKAPGPPASPSAHFGGRNGQTERRLPDTAAKSPLETRRKEDGVGGED
ncbi:MAG TPA: hypothetical protein VK914_01890 [bacterium]|jgi:hypothetical protein|nr:hypothetical protein [bacterium]